MMIWQLVVGVPWLLVQLCSGIDLDPDSEASICAATDVIQTRIMREYYWPENEKQWVGKFKLPYYWWEAGEVFGGMLENRYLCNTTKFLDRITEAMLAQTGKNYDYMPESVVLEEGNDDQGMWGILVMGAVERGLEDPPSPAPGWLWMAQAVFNTMSARWDDKACGGGLRWQIFQFNNGYDYKNTISNACLFHLAARLGRYTGEQKYLDVAEKVFDWLLKVDFVVPQDDLLRTYDGAHATEECEDHTKVEWTYNNGILMAGCAYMYDATDKDPIWEDRVTRFLTAALSFFFRNDIMQESACQDNHFCNHDQRSFKSIFSRMLAATSVLAPFTRERIEPVLRTSAIAAAKSCSGGTDGTTCGMNWVIGQWDNYVGLGEDASALEVIQNLLIHKIPLPLKKDNGGTSQGDPDAGMKTPVDDVRLKHTVVATAQSRAGAAVITAISLAALLGTALWMVC